MNSNETKKNEELITKRGLKNSEPICINTTGNINGNRYVAENNNNSGIELHAGVKTGQRRNGTLKGSAEE